MPTPKIAKKLKYKLREIFDYFRQWPRLRRSDASQQARVAFRLGAVMRCRDSDEQNSDGSRGHYEAIALRHNVSAYLMFAVAERRRIWVKDFIKSRNQICRVS